MVNGGDHADRKHETSVLVDPTTGRPILMAHARQSRPFYTGAQAGEKPCPFCPGNEHETPPSIDSWPLDGEPGPAPAPRNEPGWDVRVFPNYSCPWYRTADRRGVLATTGHSSNYIGRVAMPADKPDRHWRGRGVCLLMSLDN
jgi:hypothetical protein